MTTQPTRRPSPPDRLLIFLCVMFTAAIAGLVGGLLSYAMTPSVPGSILYGFGAAAAWIVLALLMLTTFGILKDG